MQEHLHLFIWNSCYVCYTFRVITANFKKIRGGGRAKLSKGPQFHEIWYLEMGMWYDGEKQNKFVAGNLVIFVFGFILHLTYLNTIIILKIIEDFQAKHPTFW